MIQFKSLCELENLIIQNASSIEIYMKIRNCGIQCCKYI